MSDLLPQDTLEGLCAEDGAVEQLDYLYQACERAGQKIYLFIDEYNQFTNAKLSDAESLNRYTNETHGEGYLRAFFNKVKAGNLFQYRTLLHHRRKPRLIRSVALLISCRATPIVFGYKKLKFFPSLL